MIGPLMGPGTLVGAGNEYGSKLELPSNGFDCNSRGYEVARWSLIDDIGYLRDGGAFVGAGRKYGL